MGAKLIEWNHTQFEDKHGVTRPLRGCPVSKSKELEATVKQLWDVMAEYPDVSVAQLIHASEKIRNLHAKALELCGISLDWVDIDMAVQLLHQYQTEAGVPHFGLLIEQNLPHLCVIPVDRQLLNDEIEKTHQLLEEANKLFEGLTNATTNSI